MEPREKQLLIGAACIALDALELSRRLEWRRGLSDYHKSLLKESEDKDIKEVKRVRNLIWHGHPATSLDVSIADCLAHAHQTLKIVTLEDWNEAIKFRKGCT
jgi:hypothetical protein